MTTAIQTLAPITTRPALDVSQRILAILNKTATEDEIAEHEAWREKMNAKPEEPTEFVNGCIMNFWCGQCYTYRHQEAAHLVERVWCGAFHLLVCEWCLPKVVSRLEKDAERIGAPLVQPMAEYDILLAQMAAATKNRM